MRRASFNAGTATTLDYDPLGRLKSVTAGTAVTTFLWEGDRLIAEYNGSGAVVRRYVHGPGPSTGSGQADEPLVWYEGAATANRRFLHQDRQGSVIAWSDTSGNVGQVYAYGPWGEPGVSGWTGSRFRYTGQIMIPEAEAYYYKARVYVPGTTGNGHFLQTDPIGFEGGINWYGYVGGDPVNLSDPDGLAALLIGFESTLATPFSGDSENIGIIIAAGPGTKTDIGIYRTSSTDLRGGMVAAGPTVGGYIEGGIDSARGVSKIETVTAGLSATIAESMTGGPTGASTDGGRGRSAAIPTQPRMGTEGRVSPRVVANGVSAKGKAGAVAVGYAKGTTKTEVLSARETMKSFVNAVAKGADQWTKQQFGICLYNKGC
ncbi:MAG: RHS repeat-associated core domain-containing protein [Caulobacteraceae bacterium]